MMWILAAAFCAGVVVNSVCHGEWLAAVGFFMAFVSSLRIYAMEKGG